MPRFSTPPSGNNLIYNRHYYSLNDKSGPIDFLKKEHNWAQQNNLGFILSEFESPAYNSTSYNKIASYCDVNFIPFIWWEFKAFISACQCPPWNYGITGFGGGMFSPPDKSCPLQCSTQSPSNDKTPPYEIVAPNSVWNILSPYPIKVAGTNVTYKNDPFTLLFDPFDPSKKKKYHRNFCFIK